MTIKNSRAMLAGLIGAAAVSLAVSTASPAMAQTMTGPGVAGKSITVGVLSVLTGPVALQGVPIANGVEAFFKHMNDSKSAAGMETVILKRDHQYNAQSANQIFAEMTPRVAMYADLFGTPIIAALQPRIKESGVLAIPSTFGSKFYSDPQLIVPFAP